jgi:riboflavin biosynthesis pyrimidine reductase
VTPFDEFAAAKTRVAESASVHPLTTVRIDGSAQHFLPVGNAWSRARYDGGFHLVPSRDGRLPSLTLVFVRSREGNTAAADPSELGGGDTDKHLIYEGLSRVAADAVMAGATTAAGEHVFFSVWHPEMVALRRELGLPRHPAQVVATGTGCIDIRTSRVFNVPDVPVYLLATSGACTRLAVPLRERPWVRVVAVEGDDLRGPLEALRAEFGIARISAVGGRTIATALLDGGLVGDVALTTTERSGGQPETPFYAGTRTLPLKPIVTKRSTDPDAPFLFEHLEVVRATDTHSG